jgi:hypothetical protein
MELLLFGDFLFDVSFWALLLVNKGAYFGVGGLEDSFDDIRRGCDDMLDVVFADLIVQFF